MKRLLILFSFLFILIGVQAQSIQGFFKPVKLNPYFDRTRELTADRSPFTVLIRPVVSVTAMRFTYVGGDQVFEVGSFNSFGTGIAINKYIQQPDGTPYMQFGVNLLALYDTNIGDVTPAGLSVALNVAGLNILNAGIGYSFPLRKPFLLTGIAYSF